MILTNEIKEKEEMLKQIIKEIETRRESIEKLSGEVAQLEQQGLIIRGAVMGLQELKEKMEESTTEKVEAEVIEEK